MKRMFVIAVLSGTLSIPGGEALAAKGLGGGLMSSNHVNTAVNNSNLMSQNGTTIKNNIAKTAGDVLPNGQPGGQTVGQPGGQTVGQPGGQSVGQPGGNPGANPSQIGKGFPMQNLANQGGQAINQPANNLNANNMTGGNGPSFTKSFKEMHGRLDGQTLIPGGVKITGGITVNKECKAPEQGSKLVNYVFNYCRFRSGCGPCMPGGMIELGWMPAPPAPFGDLELVNVGLVSDATPTQGPIYRVTMFNNSPMASRDFHVSLVAVLGEINESAVVVTVPVREVAPNAVGTVDVQLPANALAMGNPVAPFDTLIVAVDSFDELAETNELNNVATLTRTEVVSVTVKVEEGAAVVKTDATVIKTEGAVEAPAPGGAAPEAVPAPAPGAAPGDPNAPPAAAPDKPAPGGNVNLDNIEGASQILDK